MGMQNILKSMGDTWMPCINRLLKYVLTVKRSERIPKSEMITALFQHLEQAHGNCFVGFKVLFPGCLCVVCVLKYKVYFQTSDRFDIKFDTDLSKQTATNFFKVIPYLPKKLNYWDIC